MRGPHIAPSSNSLYHHRVLRNAYLTLGAVHVVLALLFAHERILNTDCSYQLFHSINDRGFFFQESRFGVFLTQIPVVLAIRLELPMFVLITVYSVTFPLVYLSLAIMADRVFRSTASALAIFLALTLGAATTFFHCTTETHLLIALSGLLLASFQAHSPKTGVGRGHALFLLIVLWALFTHPNALFTIGFVTAFAFLGGKLARWEALSVIGVAGLFTAGGVLLAEQGSYDAKQYDRLFASISDASKIFELYPVRYLNYFLWDLYLPVFIGLCVVVLFSKEWRRTTLMVLSMAGFMAITILTFPVGDSDPMMEKSFMPATFMVMVPLAFWMGRLRSKIVSAVLLTAFCGWSLTFLWHTAARYTERIDALRAILEVHAAEHPKLIATMDMLDETDLHENNWATSLDALMLSRVLGEEPRTLFIAGSEADIERFAGRTDQFLYLPWDPEGMTLRNRTYFDLPQGPYHVLTLSRSEAGSSP